MIRVIWMYWHPSPQAIAIHKGSGLSPLHKLSQRAWRELNPTWQLRVLGKEDAMRIAPRFAEHMRRRPPYSVCIQLQADLLRTDLLELYGGVWADMKTVPNQPLDAWLPSMLAPAGFFAFTGTLFPGTVLGYEQWTARLENFTHGDCFRMPVATWSIKCSPAWVPKDYHSLMHVQNWFLAADRAHHPLIQAWLGQYLHNLDQVNEQRPPSYFLHMCSLNVLFHECPIYHTLRAMPTPCGFVAADEMVKIMKTTKGRTTVDPRLFLTKNPIFDARHWDQWAKQLNASATPRGAGVGASAFERVQAAVRGWNAGGGKIGTRGG
jgi:hypothetical protein